MKERARELPQRAKENTSLMTWMGILNVCVEKPGMAEWDGQEQVDPTCT